MCFVSFIGDYWRQGAPYTHPWIGTGVVIPPEVTREEVDALRKEIQELRELLLAAKKFDNATGQPDCEMDEKVELLKRVADLVGVDLSEVFAGE